MAGPFEGIRLVDLSEGVGGPMAAMLLADLGAEVVKVEPPQGDRLRGRPAFHVLNRSKRGIVADLASAAGRARISALLRAADVAIIGGAVRGHAARGLNAETLRRANPGLIVVQVPYYGSAGPLAEAPEDETLLAALSGMLSLQWGYSPGPVTLTIPLAGYAHGILTAGVVAASLLAREAIGVGQTVEVSGLGAAFTFEAHSLMSAPDIGQRELVDDPRGPIPAYSLFQAADRLWFFVGCLTPAFFLKLATALELDDLLIDPAYALGPFGIPEQPDRDRLRTRLEAVFQTQPRAHWLRVLEQADVPRGPVQSREEYAAEPQVQHMEMLADVADPELGASRQMGLPIRLTDTPGAIQRGAPRLDPDASAPDWTLRAPAMHSEAVRSSPLEGIVILDLATAIAGSYGPGILADYGASVIKVEPLDGDAFRLLGVGFFALNRGKRSIALDFKSARGREVLTRLVERADVVVDNFRVGVLQRLGLDYESLRRINPRIITLSVTANGPSGPLSHLPGYDPIMQARSGAMWNQGGGADHEPVFYQVAVTDYATAGMAVLAMLAGLYARTQRGGGQRIHTSLLQNAMTVQAGEFIFYDGRPPDPPGGRDLRGRRALYRAYECGEDGWLYLAIVESQQWPALATALGRPEWLERWDAVAAGEEPVEGTLASVIAEACRAEPRDGLVQRLAAAGLPVAPCLDQEQIFAHPQVRANDLEWHAEHAVLGPIRQYGRVVKWSATPIHLHRPAPALGEHSVAILQECGLSGAAIDALLRDGTVRQADLAAERAALIP